jgi:hypothetical protein
MPAGGGGGAWMRCCGSGSGDWDPGSGSLWSGIHDPEQILSGFWIVYLGSWILDPEPVHLHLLTTCGEKTQHFLENVLLPSFVTLVPESGIRDLRSGMGRGWCPDPESGIWDEHPGFATLLV